MIKKLKEKELPQLSQRTSLLFSKEKTFHHQQKGILFSNK